MSYEFACRGCGWIGTDPTFDAHLNAWCPRCGKLADHAAFVRSREDARRER